MTTCVPKNWILLEFMALKELPNQSEMFKLDEIEFNSMIEDLCGYELIDHACLVNLGFGFFFG